MVMKQVWNLDSIFAGGSNSPEFTAYMEKLKQNLESLEKQVNQFQGSTLDELKEPFDSMIDLVRKCTVQLGEISSFIGCLTAEDVHDKQAKLLVGKRNAYQAMFDKTLTTFDNNLTEIPANTWTLLCEQPSVKPIAFVLKERRKLTKEKLPAAQEALLADLAVDGYQAWEEMYDAIVAKIMIYWEEANETKQLSVGQLENKLSDSDRSIRKIAFEKLAAAWTEQTDLFTETLNHLAGFRLQTYAHRGWDDVLKEPLMYNRMKKETINAMWQAISENKSVFYTYLKRKAELLGVDKLSWYDLEAPITTDTKKVSFDDAARTIVEQFASFSPKMANFAQRAFDQEWIEAEDRAGKRPGGFCTSFPDSKQTRIFMTYGGSASSVATLAHELGHAYHQHVMDDLDTLNQNYAMNVAETASTLAEMIVADAAVKNAKTKEEKITLLEDKIQRSVAFFMNIHARFLFETKFYQERKQGTVPTERLNELMKEAQQEAYGKQLAEYNPTFWASKLHFHITDVPFYNFPYTFGYLFSLGIYARALDNPASFESFYNALLKDTGRMNVEELAKKHLQVNLQETAFWEEGIKLCKQDVEEFLQLTEK
ncbi:oligoendopeptidase [Paraliobacillus quinghaiensis]|uniref:Oligoendopeptidase n=1 Tax=Paraliobacillus quinghaiensis TaxID=470815 RepID=A0A917TF45_9BACI|nr:M3 family oligoendopeptidase [Paraliobacillus quinghaiensis]GGM20018.1 oligoendopeptidase [Paraliobacillus quinghaiensis]